MSRIPGLPSHLKIVRIGELRKCGEAFLNRGHASVIDMPEAYPGVRVIVEPDNCYGVLDLKAIPIPDGWDRDGVDPSDDVPEEKWWFREMSIVDLNESGLSFVGRLPSTPSGDPRRIILRRKVATKRVLVVEYEEKYDSMGLELIASAIAGHTWPKPISSRIETRTVKP